MVKEYDYCSINKINKKGILFDDGYFIDFELCRVNWAKKNNILVDETHCVAERDITALIPYFKFYSNDQVVVWFKKRIFFNWRKHFQKLRLMIEKAGFTTCDCIFTKSKEFNNCYILLLRIALTTENTKFV